MSNIISKDHMILSVSEHIFTLESFGTSTELRVDGLVATGHKTWDDCLKDADHVVVESRYSTITYSKLPNGDYEWSQSVKVVDE